jgi:hypothetical protein
MDHHEKLAWSSQHLHALDLEIKNFLERNKFTARGEQRDRTREFDIIVNETPRLPSHWSLMAGDAIHNMRSALDHLVWVLSLSHLTPPDPSSWAARQIQYPITTSPDDYWGKPARPGKRAKLGARAQRLRFVPDEARTLIDKTQPHRGGDDAHDHPLAVIAAYSNEDKHKKLVASAVLATAVEFRIGFRAAPVTGQPRITPFQFTQSEEWLRTDANLGVLIFSEGTTCEHGEVIVQPTFTGDVAFGIEGQPLLSVVALEKVLDSINAEIVWPLDEILIRRSGIFVR